MVEHLDHLNLTVKDLDESVAWYGRMFGFEKVEDGIWNGLPWAIIRSGEALLCIYESPNLEPVGDASRHGISHFGLKITDPETFQQRARDNNVEILYGGVVEWPHSDAWYVEDPTGYEIEVAFWRSGKSEFGVPSTQTGE